MEAMYRIFSLKMYKMSHTVIRLAVHLPNEQNVIISEANLEQATAMQEFKPTTLMAWFELNQSNVEARQYLYCDIPYHYVLKDYKYKIRERGENKILTRMYSVSPRNTELYSLRLLLLYVAGKYKHTE